MSVKMRAKMTKNKWDELLLKLTLFFVCKKSKTSQQDIIKFCLEKDMRNVVEDFLNNIKKSNVKDSAVALQKKNEGNEKFKNKEYQESLSLYTESIFNAPKDDECLPLAYSNRSIVLQRLGYLSESIVDIDMALSCGYPKQKLEILLHRKAKCLKDLGHIEEARQILTEALKNCEKKEFYKLLEDELKEIKDKKDKKILPDLELPELVGGENENFLFASKHLSVHYDDIRGRHVIANQDIQPGDILFVEKPFAFVTFIKVCFNCCKSINAPIPCWNCTDAYYCSPKCRDDFWNSVHSFECGFDELFKSIGIAHLSLRIILKASSCLNELKNILNNISEPVYQNDTIIHLSKGYEAVYNLVHNSERYIAKDMFQYVMTALLLALYLKNHTKYFPAESDDEDFTLLTSVILRHLLQMICNGFCISGVSATFEKGKCFERLGELKIGTAIYTSASMLNHSCEPSILKSFHQNYLIIHALKAIKKGEEVFNCYIFEARIKKRKERQEILSEQYFFCCKCQHCVQKFDIYDKLMAFKCNKCKGPSVPVEDNSKDTICLSCGQNSVISADITEKQNKVNTLMKEGEMISNDIHASLKKYLEAWRIGREIFYKFNITLTDAANQVAFCLLNLKDYRRCISFLKCCVRSVEERFGFISIDLQVEMKKLADIIGLYLIHKNNTKDDINLAREGLFYYEKVKKIMSITREVDDCRDLEIKIIFLRKKLMELQRL